MKAKLTGNTQGLKPSALKKAERVFRRRVPPNEVVTPELASQMADFTHETGRQIGVMLDRRGAPSYVIVGDAHRLWLPDFGRIRAGVGRLRGLRLIHTHLGNEGLTRDDLTDLALLKLDLVAVIVVKRDGGAGLVHCAHVVPDNDEGKHWELLEPRIVQRLDLDFIELVTAIEDEFARATKLRKADTGTAAVLIHVRTKDSRRPVDVSLSELSELCRTADVSVLDSFVQRRPRVDPKFVMGRGKLDDVLLRANQLGAEMLIFDRPLSPGQARALSDATELKVIDRTMLILDIFAQHARSREGKLQVELAQLRYTLPRLVAKNTMMSRLTGGIGGRGPGETKLEINRRRCRERVARLEKELKSVGKRRVLRRKRRVSRNVPTISIVGYTNAGKSTLLNALTDGGAVAENKLFATLDPTSRRLRFPREREVVVTDTVGFIHDLPTELMDAFRATLEEVGDADLLLHIVDAADPDHEAQVDTVCDVLRDLELDDIPRIVVLNKCDQLVAEQRAALDARDDVTAISALERGTLRRLLTEMEASLWSEGRISRGLTADTHLDVAAVTVEPS